VQQTLLPWFRRWESAITRDLVVKDDIFFAEFDTRGLLRGDLAAQANWLQTMLNTGIYSINECREVLNMNPIGPDGDQRYMQMNLTTMQGIAAEASVGNAGDPMPADESPVSFTDEITGGDSAVTDAAQDVADQGVSVQDTALNGAQVASLLEILQNVAAGVLTPDGAVSLIVSAFPGVSEQQAAAMVSGVRVGATPPDEQPAVPATRTRKPSTRKRK